MTIFTVENTNNTGSGSLRKAIENAKAGDTITFASSLKDKTITLTSGQLTIDKDLIIDGSNATGIKISGNQSDRVIYIGKGIKATIKDLIITDGKTTEAGGGIHVGQEGSELTLINTQLNRNAGARGGCLFLGWKSTATIINSSFDNNDGTLSDSTSKDAGFSAGAIATKGSSTLNIKNSSFTNNNGYNGGAIYSAFTKLSIEDSVFLDNVSSGRSGGGAIFTDGVAPRVKGDPTVGETIYIGNTRFEGNQAEKLGGAIALWGYGADNAIIEDSLIINNSVSRDANGKYGKGGGIKASNTGLTLRNTTVANNTAEAQGGGLWLETNSDTKAINIVNSTISGNQVTDDAGGGAFLNTGLTPVNITNSTIAYNNAGRANGALWFSKNHQITLQNSIVAFNTAEQDLRQQQVGYQPTDGGGNIEFSPVNRANRVVPGSQVVDPRLGKLQEVDGAWVHPLLPDSPAIDAGVNKQAPTVDQRGVERDAKIDSGAFEASTGNNQNLVIGEVGYVDSINHVEQLVQFQNEYTNPVVFVSPLSRNGGDAAIANITDIEGDRFLVSVQETTLLKQQSHSGYHTQESFSYLVMEAGSWTMADGTVVEVGLTTVDSKTRAAAWDKIEFANNFNSPTVISTVQTNNNEEMLRLRQRRGDSDSIEIALEKEEARLNSTYAAETVGYLAIESSSQGAGSDEIDYISGKTGTAVTHQWYDLNTDQYSYLFASINSYNGGDSAGIRQNLDSIMIEEGTSKDNETRHVAEDVAYLGFSNLGDITASGVAEASELLI